MITTRFNPSANGPLHLGHIYMALINEAYAKERGGKFIVRWDDSHPLYLANLGEERVKRIVEEQQRDLQWLGIQVDMFINQRDIIRNVHEWIVDETKFPRFQDEYTAPTPWLIDEGFTLMYPFTPMLTAEKVVMDYWEGVTHLIRGIDLVSEYSLYQYYCRCMDIQAPVHIYLPRMKWQYGDLSKSTHARSVGDLRNSGYTADDLMRIVATGCLKNPNNGWSIENLKAEPRIVL